MLQVGTFLPTYWTDYGSSSVRTAIEETARAAEALGYRSLWVNDHLMAPDHQAEMGHIIEPLTTLASLIHLVPTIQFGTSTLVLPQRHPVLVAKQVAALDVLSGGRFILGIGVGWLEEEFSFLGADFARRGAVADEALALMSALWQQPLTTFHGRFYDLTAAVCYPKPLRGDVPLWVCGNTPAAIRRAARVGAAWDPFGIELDDFKAGIALLRREVGQRPLPTIAAHLRISIGEKGDTDAHVAGSASEVAERLLQYRQAGMEYLICDFMAGSLDDLLRQMRVMAEQIVPALVA